MRAWGGAWMVAVAVFLVNDATWATPQFFSGTGHYYDVIVRPDGLTWSEARAEAEGQVWQGQPGYLACITTAEENQFVFDLSLGLGIWHPSAEWYVGPWLGGFQEDGASEPDGGWTWIDGETWSYANWMDGQPDNNNSMGNENRLVFWGRGQISPMWNDYIDVLAPNLDSRVWGYVVEFNGPPTPVRNASWGRIKAAFH
jgi:hypothetical protein